MKRRQWTRREALKTVGVGALGVGVGAAVYHHLTPYIVGTTSDDGVVAAASLSDTDHAEIDLSDHTPVTLIRGVFSETRSRTLLSREDVAFVQPDRKLTHVSAAETDQSGAASKTLPWGIDRVDADVAHARGATGDGADVGVIDGGITATHPDLSGNVADPEVEENHEHWTECSGGNCTYPWSDDGGHGTHVAGTIAAEDGDSGVVGVAPDATLHALKVCSGGGGCRTSGIVEAIRYAADQGWDVVNLSLGSPQEAPALQAAGRYALEAGVLPVAAAGNRGSPDSVGYPAAYDEFFAVSATTIEDDVADFSSTGPEVDITAPGADVCSADLEGYAGRSGTSMAAPHVAGAAAQLVADDYAASEARQRLLDTAEDLDQAATDQGAGLVDAAAALGHDSGDDGTGDGLSCPT
jgi:subtilisin